MDRRDAVERWLDLEDRVLYPVLERELPEGDELRADGLDHHALILDALHRHVQGRRRGRDQLDALLEDHAAWSRTHVYSRISNLDEGRRQALGDALVEAWMSREGADARLTPPSEG